MIRVYRDSDLEDLLEVWYRSSRQAHPFLSETYMQEERQAIIDVYMPITKTWIWEEADQFLGFISLMDHEVGALFVDPPAQGRGIGTALLNHVGSIHPVLELDVFKANANGRRFYAHYGFTELYEHQHHDSGFPLLRLRYKPA